MKYVAGVNRESDSGIMTLEDASEDTSELIQEEKTTELKGFPCKSFFSPLTI